MIGEKTKKPAISLIFTAIIGNCPYLSLVTMKERIKDTLGKLAKFSKGTWNSVKNHPKEVIMVVGLGAGAYALDQLTPKAYAGNIEARAAATSNSGSQPIANLKNNGGDVSCIPPMPGDISIYFKRGETKLKEKVIDANNTNSENMFAEKNGGTSSSGDEWWMFTFLDSNDFDWKNVIAHRYGQSGVNDPCAVPEDTVDVKYEDGTFFQSGSFSGITSGTYDRWKFEEYNRADLKRIRKVNLVAFAVFANNWKRTGIDKGSEPNNKNDYADIDGSNTVDYNDLAIINIEWLWN